MPSSGLLARGLLLPIVPPHLTHLPAIGSARAGAFQPAREIHGGVGHRHIDIAEISRAITRRDIETSQQRYREMCEITAHTLALPVGFTGRLGGTGEGA